MIIFSDFFISYFDSFGHFTFLINWPTGPIWSISRNACPLLLSPFYVHLPGEQRRSPGNKAISYRGISALKKINIIMFVRLTPHRSDVKITPNIGQICF